MYPQHLARIDDDGSVRRICTGTAGGFSAAASPRGGEVPASAPVRPATGKTPRPSLTLVHGGTVGTTAVLDRDALADAWPLPVEVESLALSDAWPLLDVDALQGAGTERTRIDEDLAVSGTGPLRAEAVVAAVAAGRGARHRRPSTRGRRPALYVAAALLGAAGVGVTAASGPDQAAQADEPVSVAEELGLVQAEQSTLSGEEATSRLQQLVASRAQREDAQAAAAQVQRDADAAAVAAAQAAQAAAAAEAAAAEEAARHKAVLPVDGARLTSGFGQRWGTLHAGIDFAAPLGTPEYAAMDGVVVRAGAASGYGLAVYVQHENGDVTVYGHMQEILVEQGQTVKAGETIALLGNTGQSTGPHLHFEVHVGGIDGERIDPLPWLRERGVQI
jgi:murein DD-endopeptidase MepM/ murein hydrolase activator NlpD